MISHVEPIELSPLEPGKIRRTVPETVEIIKQQIRLACEGVAYRVSELQTETGIKDQTAQYWINHALERSSELMRQRLHGPETKDPRLAGNLKPDERKRIKGIIRSEVSAEVCCWVVEQPPEWYKRLPPDSREDFTLFTAEILTRCIGNSPS